MKVCEKVQKKGVTTYNEVADELVAEFSSSDNHMSPNDAVSAAFERTLTGCKASSHHVLKRHILILFFFHSMFMTRRTFDGGCMTH